MNAKPSTAFLGMGVMGAPMAMHLQNADFAPTCFNRTPAPGSVGLKRVIEAGCSTAGTPTDAARGASIVCLCVTNAPDVESLLFDQGVTETCADNALIIDFSTIAQGAAQAIGARLVEQGKRFVDAPVSGGDIGAENATLTVMAGGAPEDFAEARPLFEAVGKNVHHCGAIGSGQAVKACNQVLGAVHMVALCEAFTLAKQTNIDPKLIVEVCATGAAGSWALTNLGPRIDQDDLANGFAIDLLLKDLGIVQSAGASLPGTTLAESLLNKAREVSPLDNPATQAMIEAYR